MTAAAPVTQAELRKSEEAVLDDADVKHNADSPGTNKVVLGYDYGFDGENPFYIPDLEYTAEEERKVVRILDTRLFPWILLTTFVLNMDRTNNSNAISDNLPEDLGFDIDVVNTATAIYSVLFSVACLSGAVVAKVAGPSRCWWSFFRFFLEIVCFCFCFFILFLFFFY